MFGFSFIFLGVYFITYKLLRLTRANERFEKAYILGPKTEEISFRFEGVYLYSRCGGFTCICHNSLLYSS